MELIIITVIIISIVGLYIYFQPKNDSFHEIVKMLNNGQYEEVVSKLEPRYLENKTDPHINYYLGRAYLKLGNHQKAIQNFSNISNSGNFNSEVDEFEIRKSLALLYYHEKKFADALLEFKEFYNSNPVDAEVNAHLGFMIIGQEEFELAEEYLKNASGFKPENISYKIAYAVCLYKNNKKEEALQEFKKALKIDSESETANLLSAYISYQLENWREAESALKKVISKVNDEYLSYIIKRFLALLYYKLNNLEESTQHYKDAILICEKSKWNEERKEMLYFLSLLYLLEENFEESQNCILEIEIDDPNYKQLQELATFRSNFEDGLASLDKKTNTGFDFYEHLKELERDYFPDNFLFQLSGLKSKYSINIPGLLGAQEKKNSKIQNKNSNEINYELLTKFNSLTEDEFVLACRKIIELLGYSSGKESQGENREGLDIIAKNTTNGESAYFQFRQWPNQNVSDIFLRNLAARTNELKANNGYLVAAVNLTDGASSALDSLSKIKVYNDIKLVELLEKFLD